MNLPPLNTPVRVIAGADKSSLGVSECTPVEGYNQLKAAFEFGRHLRKSDAETYRDLVELLKSATRWDEKLKYWEAIEAIKNKYGGSVPV